MENVIIYFKMGVYKGKINKFYIGGFGYTYDINKESKKKLCKKVPTTNGYCFDSKVNYRPVDIEDIVSIGFNNYETAQDVIINFFVEVLIKFKDNEKYNNVLFISKSLFLNKLINEGKDKLIKNKYVFNKLELNKDKVNELFSLLDVYKERKVLFNSEDWADGGVGPENVSGLCGMCNTYCQLTDEIYNHIDLVPLKAYENPLNDFNKIVNSNRWYFYVGSNNDYYDDSNGYRKYYFGKVEKKKKYYGKLTPDVNYSLLYTKESIKHLDKLRDYTVEHIPNENGLLYAGITANINSKAISRMIDGMPGVPKKDKLIIPFKVGAQEDPTLIELINPPGLSFKIANEHKLLTEILNSYLSNKNEYRFKEITDLIYEKEVNGKGVTKLVLNKEFKQTTELLTCYDEHPNSVIPVKYNLVVGYDTPTRVNFNSVTDINVKVFLVTDVSNKKCSYFYSLVVCEDFLYLTKGGANIRVLNLKELGE